MFRNQFTYKESLEHSPSKMKEELSLLDKKDQQIRRLQTQLQQEKRRADNAVKMLENFKSIHVKYEEGNDSFRNELGKRLKVQEQLRQSQKRNKELQEGIKKYIQILRKEGREGGQTGEEEQVDF